MNKQARLPVMRLSSSLQILGVFLSLICIAQADEPNTYAPPVPTQEIAIARYDWHDATRDRDVPVKIYFPKDGAGPFPVVLFSHGLGGSREGYEYLGRHWAGGASILGTSIIAFSS